MNSQTPLNGVPQVDRPGRFDIFPAKTSSSRACEDALSNIRFYFTEKRDGEWVFYARIHSMAGRGRKYFMMYVKNWIPHNGPVHIKDVSWSCVKSLEIVDGPAIQAQSWSFPRDAPNPKFKLVERQKGFTKFDGDDCELIMLNDKSKGSIYQYNNFMDLMYAMQSGKMVLVKKFFDYSYEPSMSGGFTPI